MHCICAFSMCLPPTTGFVYCGSCCSAGLTVLRLLTWTGALAVADGSLVYLCRQAGQGRGWVQAGQCAPASSSRYMQRRHTPCSAECLCTVAGSMTASWRLLLLMGCGRMCTRQSNIRCACCRRCPEHDPHPASHALRMCSLPCHRRPAQQAGQLTWVRWEACWGAWGAAAVTAEVTWACTLARLLHLLRQLC